MTHKDRAVGVATTNIVLSIGGLSKDALISEARRTMVRARPLVGAEQYNNIEVNIKNTYYIFGRKTKVTINADVVEPKDSVDQATYSENYLKKLKSREPSDGFLAIGDTIRIYNFDAAYGEIIGFTGSPIDKVEFSYEDRKKEVRSKKVSVNRVYKVMQEYKGLTVGQRTQYGVIAGFGKDRYLVKMSEGYTTEKYPKE